MGGKCGVCGHTLRADIETALVYGDPLGDIAAQFGVDEGVLRNHARRHHWWVWVGNSTRRLLQEGTALMEQSTVLLLSAGGPRMADCFHEVGVPFPAPNAEVPDAEGLFKRWWNWTERFERLNSAVEAMGGWKRYWAALETSAGLGSAPPNEN